MRRFIAFIMLAVSILLGVGFATPGMMRNAKLSLDYTSGREFIYSVERKSSDDDTTIRDSEMNELVNSLSNRLNDAGVSRYNVIIEGNDQVRVQVSQDYNDKYEHIKKLMSFDSDFTLAASDSNADHIVTGEEAFGNNKAYVDYKGSQAYFVIPLANKKPVEELSKYAISLNSAGDGEATSDEGKILLWSNFDAEVDTLAKSKEDGQEEMASRILCKFDPSNLYFDEANKLLSVAITDYSSEQYSTAYALNASKAQSYVDLFNARPINLKLTFMFDEYVDPAAEAFITYDKPNTLAWSRTLLALIMGLVIVSIFMIAFYKIQGFNAVVNLLLTLFVTFGLFNAVGMTFNVAAIVGLIVVTMLSLISSIIYIETFRNEVYRGRTMKKANQEANKKTFASLIDTHLVTLLVSVVTYFVGSAVIQSLAIACVIGSLISFIANITTNRLLGWLITNDTSSQTNYKLFGIKADKIPDLTKEEKQTYYAPTQDTDFTKKAKRNGLGTLIALGVMILASIGFGVFGNGVVNYSSNQEFTRAYYELNEYGETIRDTSKDISIEYFNEKINIDQLKDAGVKVRDINKFEGTSATDETAKVYYYVIDFKGVVSADTVVSVNVEGETLETYLYSIINPDENEQTDIVSFKQVREVGTKPTINVTQPSLTNVIIVTAVAAVISALYILIRFGVARGLVTLATSVLATFLPFGFFALTRIGITSTTFVSLIGVVLINTLFTIIHARKAKEINEDKKNAETSILDNAKKALAIAATPLLTSALISSYLAIDFAAFGHEAFATTFASLLLGILVSLMVNLTLFIPMQMFIIKHVGDVNVHLPKIKKTKENTKSGNLKGGHRSAEPEEALYPGIND